MNTPTCLYDDDAIIERLEECERFATAWRKSPTCPEQCGAYKLVQERILELRQALRDHIMRP